MTPEARSAVMARIRGRDTRPEKALRRRLHARGWRYRVQVRDLPGTPDVVLRGRRAVVFVHGCFWHRHEGCPRASRPRTNAGWWREKFERNVERDRAARGMLLAAGWSVVIVWECALSDADGTVAEVERILYGCPASPPVYAEIPASSRASDECADSDGGNKSGN